MKKQKWPVYDITMEHKNLLVEDELKKTVVLVVVWTIEDIGDVIVVSGLKSWRNC